MPDEPEPQEPELDEADMLLNVLGSGAKVNPDLSDDSPAVRLVKGLAAHRDDIDREPLRELVTAAEAARIITGGHVSGFDDLAQQFEALLDQVPSIASAGSDLATAVRAVQQIGEMARSITGEAAAGAFLARTEQVAAQIRSAQAEVEKSVAALDELEQGIRGTANEIRNRKLG